MSVTPESPFGPGRWHGRWIWADVGALPAGRRVVAVRGRIPVPAGTTSVIARVVADSRYVLHADGVEVGRGPGRSNPRRLRHDLVTLPVAPGAAEVVVAALVVHLGAPVPWWMPAPTLVTAFGDGVFALEAAVGEEVVGTDATWKALPVPGFTSERPRDFVVGRGDERLDLRSLPADWADPGFDDAAWPAAVELTGRGIGEPGDPRPPAYPYGPLDRRPVTPPAREDVALAPTTTGFAAERIVVGTIRVDVEAPAGVEVRLRAGELVAPDGALRADAHTFGATIVGDGTRRTVETIDAYGLAAVEVSAGDGATVHGVTVAERLHPVVGAATFACSDPLLDRIWAVGRRTVSICSLDAYVDCPTREQRAWTGDHVVHQMVDLATNEDWTLARWQPRLTASPRPDGMLPMAVSGDAEATDIAMIPDWALHWLHGVWNLHRHVGDRDEIATLLATAEGVLRWFEPYLDAEGCLTDVIGWVIIDWAWNPNDGVCAALNGLWGRALLEFAEMASWLGDEGRAAWARAHHERLVAGFERLWDPERERYADSLVAGARRVQASQHGQAAALVGGLVPADRVARLVEVLTDEAGLVHATLSRPDGAAPPGSEVPVGGLDLSRGWPEPWWDVDRQVVRAQPFFRYVVHDALVAAGRADLIPAQCRDWAALLDRSPGSWSETWFGGTISHGWSSTPTRDLSTRVLGVTPAEPGFAVAAVEPALGDLAWARGAVPTPAGLLSVDVTPERVVVDAPVPFVHAGRRHDAGHHEIPLEAPR
ncbi:MAG TPA: hypothetical protein VFU19_02170 [Iamia sp.]|nr:hypothetical protein [Iamia sp.]